MPRHRLALIAIMAVVVACDLPRDADGTRDRVRDGRMRVGMIVDTPWVTYSAGGAGGIEGGFARRRAAELHATARLGPRL